METKTEEEIIQEVAAETQAFQKTGERFDCALDRVLDLKYEGIKALRESRKKAPLLAQKLEILKKSDEMEKYWRTARLNYFNICDRGNEFPQK